MDYRRNVAQHVLISHESKQPRCTVQHIVYMPQQGQNKIVFFCSEIAVFMKSVLLKDNEERFTDTAQ